MQENLILAYYAQIWEFGPGPPKMKFFQNFFIEFKSSYARKRDYAQIWKLILRLPKMEFFKKVLFFEKVSRFCFQRALNHPQTLSLSQVMQENVVLAYYAQIWKIGQRLPKIEFFKEFLFF